MKRIIAALLCLSAALCLAACGGRTGDVKIIQTESDIYSRQDIDSAIDVVMAEFRANWKGCTLLEIAYAGDERNLREAHDRGISDNEELIVLMSSYRKGSKSTPSINSTTNTYELWCWILIRTDGGEWRHIDHGYM